MSITIISLFHTQSEKGIYHGSIRCSNMYVTKFDPKSHIIETKIGDPGLRRSYSYEE